MKYNLRNNNVTMIRQNSTLTEHIVQLVSN